jgi:hypothetical protein
MGYFDYFVTCIDNFRTTNCKITNILYLFSRSKVKYMYYSATAQCQGRASHAHAGIDQSQKNIQKKISFWQVPTGLTSPQQYI